MSWWRRLPVWARAVMIVVVLLVVLYVFGFFLFSSGSEKAEPIS